MPSIFRQELCLPPLFYELVQELCDEGVVTDQAVDIAYEKVHGAKPTDLESRQALSRLIEEVDSAPKDEEIKIPSKVAKKTFASGLSTYLGAFNLEQLCFLLADYDPEKAKHFYCRVDKNLVVTAVREKIGYILEQANLQFESVLFGMGGHYKDHGPNDNVIDMTSEPGLAKQQLKRLGL